MGEYKTSPLPRGDKGEVRFVITLEVNETGLLRIKAKNMSSASVALDVKVDVKSLLVTEKFKHAETKEELNNKYKNLLNTKQEKIDVHKKKKVDY
jgi:hypothetical protein